jgi:hypothetical protein
MTCSWQIGVRSMVWWNERKRGIRLGALRHMLGFSVSCIACGHSARIRRPTVLRLWGERTFSRDVARDLRCSRCGQAKACIHVIVDTRTHDTQKADPDGGWADGPRYPEVDRPPLD